MKAVEIEMLRDTFKHKINRLQVIQCENKTKVRARNYPKSLESESLRRRNRKIKKNHLD